MVRTRGRDLEFTPLQTFEDQPSIVQDSLITARLEDNEKRINDALKDKDVDDILDEITPYGLANCCTNSVEMSLEVSRKLKKIAGLEPGPDQEELASLGHSVEDFAYYLLDPLKSDAKLRQIFDDNFDPVMEKALRFRTKKFASHPVINNLFTRRWMGSYYDLSTKPFGCDWLIWLLLNLWVIFDMILFPLIFMVLYLCDIICKKEILKSYKNYFETPYFVFFRDTLSYLTLLFLHFAVCVQTTSLRLSVLEWIIMVFFVGRIFMEINQFIVENSYQSKNNSLLERIHNYFRNIWNGLDLLTMVIYLVILTLRLVTWSHYGSNSRLISVGAYLYAVNAIFLTLRACGELMQAKESTGIIQIALFKIVRTIVVIAAQLAAALIAFSMAITKITSAGITYMAPRNASAHGLCKTEKGISCWRQYLDHLAWSLAGSGGVDGMDLSDGVSDFLAKLVYWIFLALALILLMNMLIALLTNTYQKVEDNAFCEWSFKKASTISTYTRYHPVPVPFNIISLVFLLFWRAYRKKCRELSDVTDGGHSTGHFHALIKTLQTEYFAEYGYAFPITDNTKLDHVMRETQGNRRLTGHIAENVFNHDVQTINTPDWEVRGVSVDGQRLCYTSCDCTQCSTSTNYRHAARKVHPLSPQRPGFEVLIKESGKKRYLAIGVVEGTTYDLHRYPGWSENTVGYHVDDGKIFDKDTRPSGEEIKDAMAYRGDLIGCEVLYAQQTNPRGLPVRFTLNGSTVGEAYLTAGAHTKNLFPSIGLGDPGIIVLFRMRCRSPCDPSTIQLNGLSDQVFTLSKNFTDLQQEVVYLSDQIIKLLKGGQLQLTASQIPTRRLTSLTNNAIIKLPEGVTIPMDTITTLRNHLEKTKLIKVHEEPSNVRVEDLITITCQQVQSQICWVARRQGNVIVPPMEIGHEETMAGNLSRFLRYKIAIERAESPSDEKNLLANVDFEVKKIENLVPYIKSNKKKRVKEGLEKGTIFNEDRDNATTLKSHLVNEVTNKPKDETGDAFVFQVTNKNDQPVYVSVLVYHLSGAINIYKNCEELQSGSSIADLQGVFIPKNSLRRMVQPDVTLSLPNMGIDTLVIYASSKPVDLSPLTQSFIKLETSEEEKPLRDFQEFVKTLDRLRGADRTQAEGFQWVIKKIGIPVVQQPSPSQ